MAREKQASRPLQGLTESACSAAQRAVLIHTKRVPPCAHACSFYGPLEDCGYFVEGPSCPASQWTLLLLATLCVASIPGHQCWQTKTWAGPRGACSLLAVAAQWAWVDNVVVLDSQRAASNGVGTGLGTPS